MADQRIGNISLNCDSESIYVSNLFIEITSMISNGSQMDKNGTGPCLMANKCPVSGKSQTVNVYNVQYLCKYIMLYYIV